MILLGWGTALALMGGGQAPKMTLDEAIRIGQSNSFSVKTAQANTEKAKQKLKEAKGVIGPKLTLAATEIYFDKPLSGTGGGSGSSRTETVGSATLSIPLDLTGAIGRGIKAAYASVRATEDLEQAARNDVSRDVRTAYFRVLQAAAILEVDKAARVTAEESLKNAKLEVEAGSKAKVDQLQFETQYAQSQADLIAAQNALDLAKQAFNVSLSRDVNSDIDLSDAGMAPGLAVRISDLQTWAQAKRPELLSILENQTVLKLITEATGAGNLPSLGLTAAETSTSLGSQTLNQSSATLGLTWPIYDSGIVRARTKQAKQDEEVLKQTLGQTRLAVNLEVTQAYTNYRNALSRLAVANKQVDFAQETFRLAQIRFKAGEGIPLEVTNAQAQLTSAKTQQANARYDAFIAYSALQRAVGTDTLPDTTGVTQEK